MNPIVSSISLNLPRPSPSDKRADRERLLDGLAETGINMPVELGLKILQILPSHLRENDFSITVTLGFLRDKAKVIAINNASVYGVAIDIGTTNMVASLFDLSRGKKVSLIEMENPQINSGLDVLSRVHEAMSGKSEDLHKSLIRGVNDLIRNLCSANNINHSDICAVVIAGNTIISHFFLNLPVENIPVEPYIPAAGAFDFLSPVDLGLDINPNGIVYVFPNAGSYVGGDIISGILFSGLYKDKRPSILIDVGTNAEIVLGCDEWIMVGAGAAGPALEGGISEIGMTAKEGAICRVRINRDNYAAQIETIGNREPEGICGSGMIDLIAELYNANIIDSRGSFTDGRSEFIIYESKRKKLAIKATDIDNFLRSKAAMFSLLYVMVKSVGLRFIDISRIYISGAFGTGIDPAKAISIGMVPDIEIERFRAVGNSSLKGAEMLLMERNLLADIDRICGMITYREMNTDGEFMREFPAAMFIPHTNPALLKA